MASKQVATRAGAELKEKSPFSSIIKVTKLLELFGNQKENWLN